MTMTEDERPTVPESETPSPQPDPPTSAETRQEREERQAAEGAETLQALAAEHVEGARVIPGVGLAIVPAQEEMRGMAAMAVTLAGANALPAALRGHPNDVFLLLLTARDLNVSLTTALREFHIIEGKVTLSPKAKLAMVNERGAREGWAIWPDPANNGNQKQATWYATRADRPGVQYASTFTIEDATRASLTGKDRSAWKTYPQRMLSWRALGYLLDDAFPEVGTGLYCVPTRAEALTRNGWRGPDKVSVGDEILAYDVDTGVCRWAPIQRIRRYEAAETFRLEHSRWAFTATAEHRWVVEPKHRGKRSRVVRPTSSIGRGEGRIVTAAPMVDQPSVLTDRDAAVIGWVLADGHIEWSKNSRGYGPFCRVTIRQSKHVDALCDLLGNDATVTVTPERTGTIRGKEYGFRPSHNFRLRANYRRRVFDANGIREKGDVLRLVGHLSASAARAMFDGMMLGNGTVHRPGGTTATSFCTGRRDVLDVFQALAAILGVDLGRERLAGRDAVWSVTVMRRRGVQADYLSVTPHEVEEVWCPTTEFGTWVARLDGTVSITGNSPDEMGAVTDEDGSVIDVDAIDPLDGMKDPRSGRAKPTPPEPATDDDKAELRRRIGVLPAAGQDAVREAVVATRDREGVEPLVSIDKLIARQLPRWRAIIDAVERRAKGGEWGEWTPPADPATGEVSDTTPTPDEQPGSTPDPTDAETPGEPTDTPQATDLQAGEPDATESPIGASGVPSEDGGDPRETILEAVIAEVKAMPASRVLAELARRAIEPPSHADRDEQRAERQRVLAERLFRERTGETPAP